MTNAYRRVPLRPGAFAQRLTRCGPCVALALLVTCFSAGAQAQDAYKLGFVNVAKVMEAMPQARAAQQRMEEEFAPRDQRVLEAQRLARAREDDLITSGTTLSADERQRAEREVRQLKREHQRMQDEFREDLNLRRSEELSKLQRRVSEVITTLAKAESYDLVLTNGVVFASERADITGAVLKQLEAEFEEDSN